MKKINKIRKIGHTNKNIEKNTFCQTNCVSGAALALQATLATVSTATTWTNASATTAAAASARGSTASTPQGRGGAGPALKDIRVMVFSVLSWDR